MLGVKGVACENLTEEINKALGEVFDTKPTQEMFEQTVEVTVEETNSVSEGWGSSSVRERSKPAPSLALLDVLAPLPHARLAVVCRTCCSGAAAATAAAAEASGKRRGTPQRHAAVF